MYSSVEQFLQQRAGVICTILEQAATEAGGHYAEMTTETRRLNAEHDAAELIAALSQGRVDRQTVRVSAARPTTTGLVADDLARLVNGVEPRMEAYIRQELADQPEFRDE